MFINQHNVQEIDFSLVEIYLAYSGHIFSRITEEYIENATINLGGDNLVQSNSKSCTQFIYDWKFIVRCFFNYHEYE